MSREEYYNNPYNTYGIGGPRSGTGFNEVDKHYSTYNEDRANQKKKRRS